MVHGLEWRGSAGQLWGDREEVGSIAWCWLGVWAGVRLAGAQIQL